MRLPQSLRRPRTWIALVVALVVLVAVVAPYVYIHFIKAEPAARPSLDDVTTSSTSTSSSGAAGPTEGIEGVWAVTDGSVVQYRVKEVLFGQDAEATGSTDAVTGALTIAGTRVEAASFTVDMTTFSSAESRRDGQFHDRIMETGQFPTATFELAEPIALAGVPADREEISATATGELTMHGVTNAVSFDLVAKREGGIIAVNAAIPVVFSDYDIDDPSGGPATVGDEGQLEVLLVLSP